MASQQPENSGRSNFQYYSIDHFRVPRKKDNLHENYKEIERISNEVVDLILKNNLSYEEAKEVLEVTQAFIGKCKVVL